MSIRIACSVALLLLISSWALADIIVPPEFQPPKQPKQPPRLKIIMDPNATSARLVLADKQTAAAPSDSPRLARFTGLPWLGLALMGSLIAVGLWFARPPKARWVVAATLPLCAIAVTGFAVAQPTSPEVRRLETTKVRVYPGVGSDYQLILPKRPVAEKK